MKKSLMQIIKEERLYTQWRNWRMSTDESQCWVVSHNQKHRYGRLHAFTFHTFCIHCTKNILSLIWLMIMMLNLTRKYLKHQSVKGRFANDWLSELSCASNIYADLGCKEQWQNHRLLLSSSKMEMTGRIVEWELFEQIFFKGTHPFSVSWWW